MTAEELRRLMRHLEEQVQLVGDREIRFDFPSAAELATAGFTADDVEQVLGTPWLEEMVEEVRETPEFCEPGQSDAEVLSFARDVVSEYFRKRFKP